jgi:hypothetical protein
VVLLPSVVHFQINFSVSRLRTVCYLFHRCQGSCVCRKPSYLHAGHRLPPSLSTFFLGCRLGAEAWSHWWSVRRSSGLPKTMWYGRYPLSSKWKQWRGHSVGGGQGRPLSSQGHYASLNLGFSAIWRQTLHYWTCFKCFSVCYIVIRYHGIKLLMRCLSY